MLLSVLIFAVSAMFLGLGIGRFAFSPLIPELINRGWLDVGAAQSVGAANLVGYFLGALLARPTLRFMSQRSLCLLSAGLVVISYAMFLLPVGMAGYWTARFLAGAGGSMLMVVATAAAGRQLVALDRGNLQPFVFMGIGLGALFAAPCLPRLLRHGVETSLFALLIISICALAALWWNSRFLSDAPAAPGSDHPKLPGLGPAVPLILLAYACHALGYVMHTVYLPDMLSRACGHTEAEVGLSWAFFGLGACAGPLFVMGLRRALSLWNALWFSFALKAAGVALVLIASDLLTASASLFIVGMLSPGIVILVSGALAATAPPGRYLSLSGPQAPLSLPFALCQMLSGILISAISQQGYDVALLCSVAILGFGAIFALAAGTLTQPKALT